MTKENADQKNKIQELKTMLQEMLDKLKQEKQKVGWLESQMKWRRVLVALRLTLSSRPAGATLSISHRVVSYTSTTSLHFHALHRTAQDGNARRTMGKQWHYGLTCSTRDAASSQAPVKEAGSIPSTFIALRIVL